MRAGVDLGGTKVQAVVVDARHRVRGQAKLPTPRDGGPPGVAMLPEYAPDTPYCCSICAGSSDFASAAHPAPAHAIMTIDASHAMIVAGENG